MDNPGFFAILPATVRYDRRLKPAEKIFYAEITSLADKTGYCYASNAYFCPLYDTTERTVQRWVKHLQELGYVAVSYARDGAANQRYISPLVGVADLRAENLPDKNVGERHPMSAGDKNVAYPPTKMSPTPRQKCHPEQYKNNNTRENNTRAGACARETAADILQEAFPGDARLTAALLSFAESRAAGKHPLTANAAKLACSKLIQLADEAGVRDRSGYMAAVLEQSILRGWEGLFPLKDDFVDKAPAQRPANTADRPREIGPDTDITDFL
jgi:hypothetical protein